MIIPTINEDCLEGYKILVYLDLSLIERIEIKLNPSICVFSILLQMIHKPLGNTCRSNWWNFFQQNFKIIKSSFRLYSNS